MREKDKAVLDTAMTSELTWQMHNMCESEIGGVENRQRVLGLLAT